MPDSVRPETQAFRELETLVRHLGDELAAFRRRALVAEARLREIDGPGDGPLVEQRVLSDRCASLESENAALKERLDSATSRTRQMLDRVRFIRQQAQTGAEAK
jgi:hypothetical protein